jgi:hypothetical protein
MLARAALRGRFFYLPVTAVTGATFVTATCPVKRLYGKPKRANRWGRKEPRSDQVNPL